METRRRKYFTITVCLVVSDATEGPHEGRCAVGRSDTGPGHPDASVAVTRAYSLGEGGREAQQGQRHAVLKQTVALDNSVFLWREWTNGAIAGGRGGGDWVFKIYCGRKLRNNINCLLMEK